nr:bifunctional phosphoglucose/phosphomannose isomerase [Candidatus Sigynarchaeota archaeon]
MSILDDSLKMNALDTQDMLGIVERSPKFLEWCLQAFELDKKASIEKKIKSFIPKHVTGIFISGMGGSAISGDIIFDWLKDRIKIPIVITREYRLPAFIDKSWLGFFLSYSGNTEETLSTYVDAKQRGIKCIGITSGGLLEEYLGKTGDLCLKVPNGYQPRAAMLYLFTTLAIAVANCNFLEKQALIDDLQESLSVLITLSAKYAKNVPFKDNPAKQHAAAIHGTAIIVYGFDCYQSVARRFKSQFNENGKNPSYFDVFSELCHNESVGWEIDNNIARNFSCIFLRDPAQESEPITVRIEFTKRIVASKAKAILELLPAGKSKLARMLSLMYMADFTSTYLALLNGSDPTPVKFIQGLKDELAKKVNLLTTIAEKIDKLRKK